MNLNHGLDDDKAVNENLIRIKHSVLSQPPLQMWLPLHRSDGMPLPAQ
jgi:hypothetical protein